MAASATGTARARLEARLLDGWSRRARTRPVTSSAATSTMPLSAASSNSRCARPAARELGWAAITRFAATRNGYIANHTPPRDVPCATVHTALTPAARAPPTTPAATRARWAGPTYRAASRPATPANTKTSSMFCFTRTAATPAAPAQAPAATNRRRDDALSAPTAPAIPTATNGAASSSPSTSVAPASGLTRKAAATTAAQVAARGPASRRAVQPTASTLTTAATIPSSRSGTAPPSTAASRNTVISRGGRSTQ